MSMRNNTGDGIVMEGSGKRVVMRMRGGIPNLDGSVP
jgi:hypothetical protein